MAEIPTISNFAVTLDHAIIQSGMPLREIADRLEQAGCPCTAANLSYWRKGRSLPRRKNSLAVVVELEKVLGLPEGRLVTALEQDSVLQVRPASAVKAAVRESASKAFPRSRNFNTDAEVAASFAQVDCGIDWNNEAVREIMEEDIMVSSDFLTVDIIVTLTVRSVGPESTLHITGFWDEGHPPAEDDIGIYNVLGARIGETITEHVSSGTVRVTTLHLPEELKPGELHHVRYERRFWSSAPLKYAVKRAFSWPFRFYLTRVTFAGEVPENIEWTLSSTLEVEGGRERTILSRSLKPYGKTVMFTTENVSNAVGSVRWR